MRTGNPSYLPRPDPCEETSRWGAKQTSPGVEQHIPVVLNLVGIPLERAGQYVVVMRINGQDAAHSGFRVVDIVAR
jgi:hypothetical protein